MNKLNRCFCTLLLFLLEFAVFQTASAEGYLYLFKTNTGEFTAVEALKEDSADGALKLTTTDGKVVVWGGDLLACKFPRFDEAKESEDPAGVETSIAAIEKFIAEQPSSQPFLKSLLDQRKEFQSRLQSKAAESTEVTGDALGRYLADAYNEERNYSLEYLEAKLKRGEEFKKLLPDDTAKITEYLRPWADELQNRQAGMQRFEGKWVSAEAIAKLRADELEAAQKVFFEKELVFKIPGEAVPEQTMYIVIGVVGLSVLILLCLAFYGGSNVTQGFGLGAVLAMLIGLGGLVAYGYAGWTLFSTPESYVFNPLPKPAEGTVKNDDNLEVAQWIFRICHSAGKKRTELSVPSRYLVEDAKLNDFLGKYLKIETASSPGAYAVTRKGLKVRVLVDRILIFDELELFSKDVTVCYSFSFLDDEKGFQFFGKSASAGGLPLPGKVFQYLWAEVQPVVTDILEKSKILENYHIARVENGSIEMISNRNPPKPASP